MTYTYSGMYCAWLYEHWKVYCVIALLVVVVLSEVNNINKQVLRFLI